MAKLKSTVGQILVNSALPEELRDYSRALDKPNLSKLLAEVGKKYPGKYRDISHRLSQIGAHAAYVSGVNSFGLEHLRVAKSAVARRRQFNLEFGKILNDDRLTDKERARKIILLAGESQLLDRDEIYAESDKEGNPFATQLKGTGRGNKVNLQSLRGSDWLYQDHQGRVIPVPITRSYSRGLSPIEYWAGTYGAREGVLSAKFATRNAGYLSKQLNQVAHRLVVTDVDRDGEPDTVIGLPVPVDDDDNEGSLLAMPAGGYKRNTVLTPKILNHLRRQGVKRLLVRSPAAGGAPDGSLYARDVGVREFGVLPSRGELPGIVAAQALSEPLAQAQLSKKHSGGVVGGVNLATGFDYLRDLLQVPKTFKGTAAHARLDGAVRQIEDAPAGGKYVTIDDERHYVGSGYDLLVKPGDKVEAGDVLSEGEPNPAMITQYKGLGEGRRYFIKAFTDGMRNSGMRVNRRNVELLARGLINHVRLTEEIGDFAPDDVVAYSTLASYYKPREGFEDKPPIAAVGRYLEKPYLHYSIGTRLKPSMAKTLNEFGINSVTVHADAPPFEPEMIRAAANLRHDEDWQTRMFDSGLKGSLLANVHRGGTSDEAGTSFVPALAKSVRFGEIGAVRTPKRELGY